MVRYLRVYVKYSEDPTRQYPKGPWEIPTDEDTFAVAERYSRQVTQELQGHPGGWVPGMFVGVDDMGVAVAGCPVECPQTSDGGSLLVVEKARAEIWRLGNELSPRRSGESARSYYIRVLAGLFALQATVTRHLQEVLALPIPQAIPPKPTPASLTGEPIYPEHS